MDSDRYRKKNPQFIADNFSSLDQDFEMGNDSISVTKHDLEEEGDKMSEDEAPKLLDSENTTQAEVESNVVKVKEKGKKRRRTSIVWDHFNDLPGYTQEDGRAKCRHCGAIYKVNTKKNGTKSMLDHLRKQCPSDPLALIGKKNKEESKKKSVFTQKKDGFGDGESGLICESFNIENTRKLIAEMVIIDELPFSFVENKGFRRLMSGIVCLFEPRFVVPSQNTVLKEVMEIYKCEKQLLKEMFKTQGFRMSLTTDTWTSIQNINYMVLTGHFIDDDWKIHKRILNFCLVENHRGETIGKNVERCLKEWGIERFLTLTVDNVSSNDTTIAYIVKRYKNNLVLNGEYLHVRCCTHILNLIVRDSLKDVDESVSKIRNVVRYVRSSPARLARFKSCIEEEKIESNSFVCLDVATRWNSTYLMLDAAQKFAKAFDRLENHDTTYMGEDRPNNVDWEIARIYVAFLTVFYGVMKRILGSLYVTSNHVYKEISLVQNTIKKYSSPEYGENFMRIATKMQEKFDKYWGNTHKTNLLLYVATLMDPRYKMKILSYCFQRFFDPEVGAGLCKKVEGVLRKLFDEYNSSLKLSSTSKTTSSSRSKLNEVVEEDPFAFLNGMDDDDNIIIETEVDIYLMESRVNDDDKFDILYWWKCNAPRFPVLSKVARDLLSIPVSTVASESAFSIGGRIVDPFRSSLAPTTIEALICTQNWLDCDQVTIDLKHYLDEVVRTEEEFAICINGVSPLPSQSQSGQAVGSSNTDANAHDERKGYLCIET